MLQIPVTLGYALFWYLFGFVTAYALGRLHGREKWKK